MDEQARYLFDLQGYIIVRNALTEEQVAAANAKVDSLLPHTPIGGGSGPAGGVRQKRTLGQNRRAYYGSARSEIEFEDGEPWSAASLLSWGGVFHEMLDAPSLEPYLTALLGVGYRLDHDYLAVLDPEHSGRLGLHGGGHGAGGRSTVGATDGGQCFYHQHEGRFFNGLVGVAIELNTVGAGDGGFACVPGSHKVAFDLPREWRMAKTQEEMPDCVKAVEANAGDAIIFTEALTHGTIPWNGAGERRTCFYKYCPHAVGFAACYYNSDEYPGLSQRQLELLLPPSASPGASATLWQHAQADHKELLALREQVAELQLAKL